MTQRNHRILSEFVSLPTAPFCEQAPVRFIRRFVAARPALSIRADRFGNLLVRYRRGPARARPVVFAGHLDHPGFVATGSDRDGRITADFRGWVDRSYFLGERVRFFTPGGEVVGVIDSVDGRSRPGRPRNAEPRVQSLRNEKPPERVTVKVRRPVPPGSIGMWDFPGCRIRGHTLFARACDDVAGVSAILCALDALCRTRARGDCIAFFTRAEEVGFGGALAAVADRVLPRRAIVVAVECSRAITGVTMGGGPVLRVGDKASIFTPAATAWCHVVAERLAAADRSFRFQRKLMDGGTCESTVYCHYGYEATGLCLPLGNYHNMDRERRRIAPEFIDLRDFENLVKWFVALATTRIPYTDTHPGLDLRLKLLLKRHRPRLLNSASRKT
jgi:putative aminopeptidase FrvX